ncbi:hypothetical protein C1T30_43490, partial [Bacillus sp. MBGLi97]
QPTYDPNHQKIHMPHKTPIKHYQNIKINTHINTDKTTTTAHILFYTDMNHKINKIHNDATTIN